MFKLLSQFTLLITIKLFLLDGKFIFIFTFSHLYSFTFKVMDSKWSVKQIQRLKFAKLQHFFTVNQSTKHVAFDTRCSVSIKKGSYRSIPTLSLQRYAISRVLFRCSYRATLFQFQYTMHSLYRSYRSQFWNNLFLFLYYLGYSLYGHNLEFAVL